MFLSLLYNAPIGTTATRDAEQRVLIVSVDREVTLVCCVVCTVLPKMENGVMPAFIHNRSGHLRIGEEHGFLDGLHESVDNRLKTVKGTVKCAQVAVLPLPRTAMQWRENETPIQCVCNDG